MKKKFKKIKSDFIQENPDYIDGDEEWEEKLQEYIDDDKCYYTYEEYRNELEYEQDVTNFTTPNGEKVVAMCYYGNDW